MKSVVKLLSAILAGAIVVGSAVVVSRLAGTPAPVAAPRAPAAPSPPSPSPEQPAQPEQPARPEQPQEPSPPPSSVPRGIPAQGKAIEVSIEHQELIAWQDGRVVYRFTVSTGRKGYETPTGRFRVHTKYDNRWSRTWKVWMPYAMFWHPKYGYAFHELPYKDGQPNRRIGASKLGTADSHGCVRVNLGDAKTLYDWTPVGTPVWVH